MCIAGGWRSATQDGRLLESRHFASCLFCLFHLCNMLACLFFLIFPSFSFSYAVYERKGRGHGWWGKVEGEGMTDRACWEADGDILGGNAG